MGISTDSNIKHSAITAYPPVAVLSIVPFDELSIYASKEQDCFGSGNMQKI